MKVTEKHVAIWACAGAFSLLAPALLHGLLAHLREAAPAPPRPAIVVNAEPALPTTEQVEASAQRVRKNFLAEIQTGQATFTVFAGTATATGIIATEYRLRMGSGSYLSTLPVFLAGAKAGTGTVADDEEIPAGKSILWAGDAYLAGASRQQSPDGTTQSLYQYALSPQDALTLLSARDDRLAPSPEAASTAASQ